MKKITVLFLFIAIVSKTAICQKHSLFAHDEGGNIYLSHTVIAKENWYSVGRIYNISPKDLAPFNGLTIDHPLSIGQILKIPLTSINFSQDGLKNADETFVPVYHIVRGNEKLSNISSSFNKVPTANLLRWNKMKSDATKSGMSVVVGYLKVKSSLSYLANEGVRNNEVTVSTSTKENSSNTPTEKTETVKTPVTSPTEKKPPTDNPNKQEQTPSPNDNKPVFTSNNTSNTNHYGGGYFATDYNNGNNVAVGLAGIFKSTSGWNDGKYYVLINNVQVGTIVKIIAPATQKSVYAKVLGQLPEMKESEGLSVRMSSAAANALGESEGKFNVQIKW